MGHLFGLVLALRSCLWCCARLKDTNHPIGRRLIGAAFLRLLLGCLYRGFLCHGLRRLRFGLWRNRLGGLHGTFSGSHCWGGLFLFGFVLRLPDLAGAKVARALHGALLYSLQPWQVQVAALFFLLSVLGSPGQSLSTSRAEAAGISVGSPALGA
jgi:hypothetical protein